MIFLDTETCGLHGPIVLLQWAQDDGPIYLHSVWKSPVKDTLELIEEIYSEDTGICGFNLAFDTFHLAQTYTTLSLLSNCREPPDIIEYALKEEQGRFGPCLKPKTAIDIMLHARKGPYQSTMDRGDITIKKVPTVLAWQLCEELAKRIKIKDIYFARKEDQKRRWRVQDIDDDFGDIIPDFKNVVLEFAPTSALKALAIDALGLVDEDVLFLKDTALPDKAYPFELGYAPFATAPFFEEDKFGNKIVRFPSEKNWYSKWPTVIGMHISHWSFNPLARRYATDDVKYTRDLYKYFGCPPSGDDDSILACMVGPVRWRGFAIDKNKIIDLKQIAIDNEKRIREKFNYGSPEVCRKYLTEVMSETERLVMRVEDKITTKATVLEEVAKWKKQETCTKCRGEGCPDCMDGLIKSDEPHPAAQRAQDILDARHAKKEIEIYDKLLLAGRFHASFNVIGALSSRMSGADGLNPQGIKRAKEVRKCFPLADCGMVLSGGDFAGFEVTLVDATYHDTKLHSELLSGKKIHATWGSRYFFPTLTYEQICKTKGLPDEQDKYTRSKNGVFAIIYFGEGYTLHNRIGIDEQIAEEAFQKILSDYPEFAERRKFVMDMFCSMRQPGGIGTKVEWHEPADFIETMLGFRRYFTLENTICKALFDLAEDPPKQWQKLKINVVRRDRVQTSCGALRSALFAAAFAQQAANMRAAGNHIIQGTGAQLCKKLQRRLWDIQPAGIYSWRIQPLNVHDEIMAPVIPIYIPAVKTIVNDFVKEFKIKIPLLEIEWSDKLETWADK